MIKTLLRGKLGKSFCNSIIKRRTTDGCLLFEIKGKFPKANLLLLCAFLFREQHQHNYSYFYSSTATPTVVTMGRNGKRGQAREKHKTLLKNVLALHGIHDLMDDGAKEEEPTTNKDESLSNERLCQKMRNTLLGFSNQQPLPTDHHFSFKLPFGPSIREDNYFTLPSAAGCTVDKFPPKIKGQRPPPKFVDTIVVLQQKLARQKVENLGLAYCLNDLNDGAEFRVSPQDADRIRQIPKNIVIYGRVVLTWQDVVAELEPQEKEQPAQQQGSSSKEEEAPSNKEEETALLKKREDHQEKEQPSSNSKGPRKKQKL